MNQFKLSDQTREWVTGKLSHLERKLTIEQLLTISCETPEYYATFELLIQMIEMVFLKKSKTYSKTTMFEHNINNILLGFELQIDLIAKVHNELLHER
jgi:hypothetical protein